MHWLIDLSSEISDSERVRHLYAAPLLTPHCRVFQVHETTEQFTT